MAGRCWGRVVLHTQPADPRLSALERPAAFAPRGKSGELRAAAEAVGVDVSATDADIDGTLNSSMSAVSSEDERLTPHDRTLRQTMALPRTTDGMNELLASKKRRPPALSPAQEWFFGI